MIKKIIVYGERNSGTTFIKRILRKNFLDIEHPQGPTNENGIKLFFCWKHGIPVDIEDPSVLYICIFRNLHDWLRSMYRTPYHIESYRGLRNMTMEEFLTEGHIHKKEEILEYHSRKEIGQDDDKKTIFEIRYHKLISHLDFFEKQENIIHINMEYAINNVKNFFSFLCKEYSLLLRNDPIYSIPNTNEVRYKKLGYKINTFPAFTKDQEKIISKNKIEHLEKYVNVLQLKFKSCP